jgi:hypothetical protein
MFGEDGEQCGFRPVVSGIILELRKSKPKFQSFFFFFQKQKQKRIIPLNPC